MSGSTTTTPLFMEKGQGRGGLHGGEGTVGRAGGHVGDHWYKYRDGHIRNGLSVMTYNLADAPAGAGGFACIPASHKSNLRARYSERGAPI